jgi:endogenous inhibitor of DNA gyrase (YacG/DUF329 family)
MKPAEKAPGGEGKRGPGGNGHRCPICGKRVVHDYRPFCSRRCADIDLGRWLRGGYALPGEEAEDAAGGGNEEGGAC